MRAIADRLEAAELFEARRFSTIAWRYVGTWIDLSSLARDLGGPHAGNVLQAIALAARLAEVPDDAPVLMMTSEVTAERRPGTRTLRRVDLDSAGAVVRALRGLKQARGSLAPEDAPSRLEVLEWLRARAARVPAASERIATTVAVLSKREAPTRGPLSETALWNLEAKLSRGETTGVLEQIEAIEQRRGRVPGTIYLRARLALMTKTEEPLAVAERVSSLSQSLAGFHELQLLAAKAWLATGDSRRARAFARDLEDNASADGVVRMEAAELLENAGPGSSAANVAVVANVPTGGAAMATGSAAGVTSAAAVAATAPARRPTLPSNPDTTPASPASAPAPPPSAPPSIPAPARRNHAATTAPDIPRAPLAPTGTDLEVPSSRQRRRAAPPEHEQPPLDAAGHVDAAVPHRDGERSAAIGSPALARRAGAARVPQRTARNAERAAPVEAIAPRNPAAARLACTYLTRELGRELRLQHGVELRDDLDGLEAAQRYLRETLVDGRVRNPDEEREVMRYGAYVSELVARKLGGQWDDVTPRDAGTWAMIVRPRSRPNEAIRAWPFGRVLRFVVMAHRERDLVSYLLELEARAR